MENIDMLLPKEERILLAAEKVFSAYGYKQATVDEIIKIADTGKGTVYNYFGNKEQLFYSLISRKNKILISEINEAVDKKEDFAKKLENYFTVFIEFIEKNKTLWQVLVYEMTGRSKGIHVYRNEEKKPQIVLNWEIKLSEKEKEQILRYSDLIYSSYEILYKIIEDGVKNHDIDDIKKIDIATGNLYGGVLMSIFFIQNPEITPKQAAKVITKRFMYGYVNCINFKEL